ncbi:hypothetical protein Dimus_038886 [Dionaea muscipula]
MIDDECQRIVSELVDEVDSDFTVSDGLLRFRDRVCVPDDSVLREELMTEAHCFWFSIHPGSTKMYRDLREHFWWSGMKRVIAEFVSRYLTCQQVKIEYQRPTGRLQPLPIPEWKWEHVMINYVSGLPLTRRGHDGVWVIVDRLTKSAHFLAIRITFFLDRLARLYLSEIIRLHGAPIFIVSDRDPRFISKFWGALHKAFRTRLSFSTTYHLQTDGQSERTI